MQIDEFSYDRGVVVSDACKIWPKDNAITLVAVAYHAGAEDALNLAVAMTDNGRNTVIASYKGLLGKQADLHLGQNSLNIDTARYDVSKGIRAFGVDVTKGNFADCGERKPGRVRNLYVLDGDELRPIIEGFYLSCARVVRGSNPACTSSENAAKAPEPVIETITLKIALGKSVTHDYFDLSVFSISSYDDGSQANREPFQYELKYDGRQYPLTEMHKAYLEWLR